MTTLLYPAERVEQTTGENAGKLITFAIGLLD